jgi:hypothetical protein
MRITGLGGRQPGVITLLGTGYTVGLKATRRARLVCGDVAGPEAQL